jgi:hypothetical protein
MSSAVPHVKWMPRWLYRLRFILQVVRMCWPSPNWTLREAWAAGTAEFDALEDWCHSDLSPEDSARESVSYWDNDEGGEGE